MGLGSVQVLGSIALRESAQAGSWVRAVPSAVAERVDRLDPGVPVPPALRLVLARNALARGDLALAARDLAVLPASRDRLALTGELAEARGDLPGAVRAFLSGGDLGDLEEHIARVVRRGDIRTALELQRKAVERLQGDRTQVDALAEAYFGLGRLQETQAYAFAVGSGARRANEALSADAYAHAVALAPLNVLYLLGLGNQQLNLGDASSAQRTFTRAREADPTSAEALTGLGDAALRRGDALAARRYLQRALVLDPASDAVRRLARTLGR